MKGRTGEDTTNVKASQSRSTSESLLIVDSDVVDNDHREYGERELRY